MTFLSLDLEMNQPSGKIIQVGYVVGNAESDQILVRRSFIINPHEVLSDFIVGLTGITQEQVDSGISLEEAQSHIIQDMKAYECFRNPITWGGGDSEELRKQLGLDDENFVFGRRWIDAKTLFVSWSIANGKEFRGGLSASMKKLGFHFEGKKHDALCDAYNTFLVFRKLLSILKEKAA